MSLPIAGNFKKQSDILWNCWSGAMKTDSIKIDVFLECIFSWGLCNESDSNIEVCTNSTTGQDMTGNRNQFLCVLISARPRFVRSLPHPLRPKC